MSSGVERGLVCVQIQTMINDNHAHILLKSNGQLTKEAYVGPGARGHVPEPGPGLSKSWQKCCCVANVAIKMAVKRSAGIPHAPACVSDACGAGGGGQQ